MPTVRSALSLLARHQRHLAAALPLLAACAAPAPTPMPGPVPGPVYAAVPGFDSYYYPGDSALRAWRAASPYRWVGYYLPAPCHRERSWAGRRATIERLGWGIAVLYVGQQTWEGQVPVTAPAAAPPADSTVGADSVRTTPDSLAAAAPASPPPPPACAPSQLTAERGALDAADAVAAAAADGFAPGTIIYLDVERMQTVPPAMLAYLRAWLRGVAADGRYRAGLYAHAFNAEQLYDVTRDELAAAGVTEPPSVWIARQAGFDLTKRPTDVGLPFARIWQGAFDVSETWGGVTLRIDANVADESAIGRREPE